MLGLKVKVLVMGKLFPLGVPVKIHVPHSCVG
jgi:hypothetical protein